MRFVGITILALFAATAARADFMSDNWTASHRTATHSEASSLPTRGLSDFDLATRTAVQVPLEAEHFGDVFETSKPQPPLSDSAAVLLAGLGGVGVWQAGRNAKKFVSSIAPDWYHTGGPNQIGHSTPLPYDFSNVVAIDVAFELPIVVIPHVSYRVPLVAASPPPVSWRVSVLAPRAPPHQSA